MAIDAHKGAARIRPEIASDAGAVRAVTQAAFEKAKHSSGNEAAIVEALRRAGVAAISLVAEAGGVVVGHIVFSPVLLNGRSEGWFGLGPVSVMPDHQRNGIGSILVRAGLSRLKASGARGCVVLGEPQFYKRFGFCQNPRIRYVDAPAEYFMVQAFSFPLPEGAVTYHPAFEAMEPGGGEA